MSARSLRTLAFACALGAFTTPLAGQAVPAGAQAVTIPDSPVGRPLREWLDAFNSGDSARLGAYYRRYGVQRSLDMQMARRQQTGGYDLVSIERATPTQIDFLVRERNGGALVIGLAETSPDGKTLVSSNMVRIPPGATLADFRIDNAEKKRVIESAIAQLDSSYVFPDVSAKMAAAVRARLARGEYAGVNNGMTFSWLLTEHLQDVSHDKHLRVNFFPTPIPERRANAGPDSAARARYVADVKEQNCGFMRADILEGNVGYVKFNFFADPDVCGATASAALHFVANARALIFDLRENGGGDPAMVAYITSYLFDQRTHLNDLWTRKTNETEEYWTRDVPGAKYGGTKPVYVLTASRTFSGGEEFTNNLKTLKRATIIGETTGGGAHPVSGHRIDEHFMIGVPFARAINPYTKTNWEGTGVEPDVKVPADQALDVAKKLIGEKKATP